MSDCRPLAPAWAWAAAVAACLAAGTARAQTAGYQGNVFSVNPQTGQVVVTDALTGQNFEIVVNAQTRLLSSLGRPLTLADVRKGDGVGIATAGAIARSVVVNQGVLRGVVQSVDLDKNTVVVEENDTKRQVTLPLEARTPIRTFENKALVMKDLKSGDGVLVRYNGRGVAGVIVNPKPSEVTAHVKSVGADMRSLLVTEVGTDADYRVVVTPKTAIVTSEGKTLGMKDLRPGDGVGIAHKEGVASEIVVSPSPAR